MIILNSQLPSVLRHVLTRHEESSFGTFKGFESHCWLDQVLQATVDSGWDTSGSRTEALNCR